MDRLRARPVSGHEDDGMNAVYECQACLAIDNRIADPYDIPDHIRCSHCGYLEGDDE